MDLKIIEVLVNNQLTINQISKQINKSYSFTHAAVIRLIKKKIILEQRIGHSTLCTLNYDNQEVIGMLVLNSTVLSQKFLEKNEELKEIISKAYDHDVLYVKASGKGVVVVSKEKIEFGTARVTSKLEKLEKDEVIIMGHEYYWRKVR